MGRIGCLAFTSWHSIHHPLRHEVCMVSVATYTHKGVSDRGACGALGWMVMAASISIVRDSIL